ncbi:MAG: patatin-like phospholipase family protein [Acidobacteriota bacterium]|nr:patatin-like phospholipase family protein [Acidobacteriota bacterium]
MSEEPHKTEDKRAEKRRLIEDAKKTLDQKDKNPAQLLELAKDLKGVNQFSFARRILELATERIASQPAAGALDPNDLELHTKIIQQFALCTYKDTDLPADSRLDQALGILGELDSFPPASVEGRQETFGLIGAIFKRKWEIDNQRRNLERSLEYYEAGCELGLKTDDGYTAINTAFVLDLLADQIALAHRLKGADPLAGAYLERSEQIRKDIVDVLVPANDPANWWLSATVAEAHFGLMEYDKAAECVTSCLKTVTAKGDRIDEWEIQSTITQLAKLAYLQRPRIGPQEKDSLNKSWKKIAGAFGASARALDTAFTGKVGLALSGGGFRASFYHIGMLAKLAELDVLRLVEVISCVSGGSVIGAHYYIALRQKLESCPDSAFDRDDYVELVEKIAEDFLDGVRRNLRVRLFSRLEDNFRMLLTGSLTRTLKVGDLYESEIFSKVQDRDLYLDKLNIYPQGDRSFEPKLHNWRRENKVPMLFLNCATLNTGHNWQFTTTWMGEPPTIIETDIDMNDVLRRMYYWEAPRAHRHIRLGHAVAASTCVPGLFEPLALSGLYEDRVVSLVDGGVCDNQGISSLLEQDCQIMLVSDGSGQTDSVNVPKEGAIGVLARCFNIFQSRIRDAQFGELDARRRASLLRGLTFIHLKKGLDRNHVPWIEEDAEDEQARALRTAGEAAADTSFGISKELQKQMAGIRTDLDAFSDLEAYALMASGYLMTEEAFQTDEALRKISKQSERHTWKFLTIANDLKETGEDRGQIAKILSVSGSVVFKVWRLDPKLKVAAWAIVVIALTLTLGLFWLLRDYVLISELTIGKLGVTIVSTIFLYYISSFAIGKFVNWVDWKSAVAKLLAKGGLAVAARLGTSIHTGVFDRLFLRHGSLETFKKIKRARKKRINRQKRIIERRRRRRDEKMRDSDSGN